MTLLFVLALKKVDLGKSSVLILKLLIVNPGWVFLEFRNYYIFILLV